MPLSDDQMRAAVVAAVTRFQGAPDRWEQRRERGHGGDTEAVRTDIDYELPARGGFSLDGVMVDYKGMPGVWVEVWSPCLGGWESRRIEEAQIIEIVREEFLGAPRQMELIT